MLEFQSSENIRFSRHKTLVSTLNEVQPRKVYSFTSSAGIEALFDAYNVEFNLTDFIPERKVQTWLLVKNEILKIVQSENLRDVDPTKFPTYRSVICKYVS